MFYSYCTWPGCANKPRKLEARYCHTHYAESLRRKAESVKRRDDTRKRHALCKHEGCTNEHFGRSCYCQKHLKQPRGANGKRAVVGTLANVRKLLQERDVDHRLSAAQAVTLWNPLTNEKRTVLV